MKNTVECPPRTQDEDRVFNVLKGMKLTRIQSFLIGLFKVIVEKINPSRLLAMYKDNRLSEISDVNTVVLNRVEGELFRLLPKHYVPVDLSPVSTLGSNSVLTNVSQKTVLATIRAVEVVGDPTTALALECAKRREKMMKNVETRNQCVSLASAHRVLRLQDFSKIPGFTAHFKAFAMATAGQDTGSREFMFRSVSEQIAYWLRFLTNGSDSSSVKRITVSISHIEIMEKLIGRGMVDRVVVSRNTQTPNFIPFKHFDIGMPDIVEHINRDLDFWNINGLRMEMEYLWHFEQDIISVLRKKFPQVIFNFDLGRHAGIGYYSGICFKVSGENQQGVTYPLIDGGSSFWTKKLLTNRHENLLTSGFGSELFCKKFIG